MKNLGFALILLMYLASCTNKESYKGPYLGQEYPNAKPVIFAPGIVSNSYDERMIFFCNDGNECFFQIRGVPKSVIVHMRNTSKGWTKPETAFFSGVYFEEFGLSQDGNTLIFTSNKPIVNKGEHRGDFYLWKSVRKNGVWPEPEFLGEQFKGAGYPTISNNGNIYFFDEREDGFGKGDIYISEFLNGKYLPPKNLGDSINTKGYDVDPFIAPDESYLIYASHNESYGGLFISYKHDDGSWAKSIFMGIEIGKGESICPSVSSDGKYLFFTSMRNSYVKYNKRITYDEKMSILNGPGNGSNDIYWVNTSVIQELKPKYL